MNKIRPHWLAILGTLEISEGTITASANMKRKVSAKSEKANPAKLNAIARCDTNFEAGDIYCEIRLGAVDTKVQFRLGVDSARVVCVGLNVAGHAYGIALMGAQGATPLSLSGDGTQPAANSWIPIHIRVRGSWIELFVSGVMVASASANISPAQAELVFSGSGPVSVRGITFSPIRPRVFVVMQFTDEYDALYREVIAPVCAEFGFEVVRADDIYTNGLIIEDIVRSIRESSLIIADITPNNPNVFYEVGYAHGIQKETILLSDRKREKLPFDISGFRLLFYDNTIGGKTHVEAALRKHLEAIRA